MLEAPWALLALLSLPVLIWIHRRRRQGVPVDVPSLLFLEPEDVEAVAPDRRRFDAELALTLLAATCLALAAAGPRVAVGAPAPKVRVVLDVSPAMEAKATPTSKSPREQAEAALAALGLADIVRARGKPTDLLAAARREPAVVRIVVSDRAIAPAPPDVHVAAYGDPTGENVGIVAVNVRSAASGEYEGFTTVWNHSAASRTILLSDPGKTVLAVPANTARSTSFLVQPGGRALTITASAARDALSSDDAVELTHGPLRVHVSKKLPDAHRRAVEQVLVAVLGSEGFRLDSGDPELAVVTEEDVLPENKTVPLVTLSILAPGQTPSRFSPRPQDETDPVLQGIDAGGAECLGPPESSLRVGPPNGLVEAAGSNAHFGPSYTWFADPLAGSPAPADTPAWPVFWANLIEKVRGDDVGAGWRARGVLDPDVTRLGRDRIPIDPAWIAQARPAAPEPKDLRLPLIAGGVLCLLLLWFAPRGGRVATVG